MPGEMRTCVMIPSDRRGYITRVMEKRPRRRGNTPRPGRNLKGGPDDDSLRRRGASLLSSSRDAPLVRLLLDQWAPLTYRRRFDPTVVYGFLGRLADLDVDRLMERSAASSEPESQWMDAKEAAEHLGVHRDALLEARGPAGSPHASGWARPASSTSAATSSTNGDGRRNRAEQAEGRRVSRCNGGTTPGPG